MPVTGTSDSWDYPASVRRPFQLPRMKLVTFLLTYMLVTMHPIGMYVIVQSSTLSISAARTVATSVKDDWDDDEEEEEEDPQKVWEDA